MHALILEDIGKIKYKETKKPIPGENEVLIKVEACGVCGSDIPRVYKDGAHNMPLILGHEFSGCVIETGKCVESALVGKRVGIFPLIPCKKCSPCKTGKYEMCKNYSYLGSRCNGGFAEYVCVPRWNIIELPINVSYESAAMLEPMSVAVHAMRRTEPSIDDVVAVCGLGTIGMLLTMFLIDRGVKRIIVIGNKDFQKKKILELGIKEENYCDSRVQNPLDFILAATDNEGADVFYECVGRNETVSLAVQCAAAGGNVCFVGNPASDMLFDKNVYWKILRNQIRITGTWNSTYLGEDYNGDYEDDWHYVLRRLETGRINPEALITHKCTLDTTIKGMEIMRDKSEDYIKVMCCKF